MAPQRQPLSASCSTPQQAIQLPVRNAIAKLFSGTTLLQSDTANPGGGFYEMTGLTAGTGRTLKVTGGTGYVNGTLRKPISITSGQVAGPSTDALPQARTTGNATVTIDWKTFHPINDTPGCMDTCNGWEFNLALETFWMATMSSVPTTPWPTAIQWKRWS